MNYTTDQKRISGNCADTSKPLVSIVVPAFNEESIIENNLTTLYHYLVSIEDRYEWELIIVNDGSTDNSGDIAERFADNRENIIVLHHMYNFRLGQALRLAFNNCNGDYVVVMDIDLSYSPDHIDRLVSELEKTHAKIVIASPYMKGGKTSNVPWLRRKMSVWANRFLSFILTRDTFSDRLTTLTGMVRGYDGKFLYNMNLRAMDVDIHTEIVYKAMVLRARIIEIPAHLDWGPIKNLANKRKSSMRMMKSIIITILSGFMLRPFMFFIFPGLMLLMLSLYPIFWVFVHVYDHFLKLPVSDLPIDYKLSDAVAAAFSQAPHAFIVGGVALLGAIQLISLGLQTYQGKQYYEELFHLGSDMNSIRRGKRKK